MQQALIDTPEPMPPHDLIGLLHLERLPRGPLVVDPAVFA